MKVIVPCGGRSSRYPNMAPKWMLPDHDGVPMVVRAVEALEVDVADVIITILKEHEDRFDARAGIERAFGRRIETVILPQQTQSQSETVAETIRMTGLNESFLVKDSDNCFTLSPVDAPYNYVSVASLNDFDYINPRNKSYTQVDHDDVVLSIREKKVISDLFSVGGYFFTDPKAFMATFEEISAIPTVQPKELYISEIISFMIQGETPFKIRRVKGYRDWGTVHEWRQKLNSQKLYFVSIDGFLFERGSQHFAPGFDQVNPHDHAAKTVRHLGEAGHAMIYLSIRPPELESMTRDAIAGLGLPPGPLLMGCGVAQWNLVTSPDSSLPFETSRSFEVDPADPNLFEKIEGNF